MPKEIQKADAAFPMAPHRESEVEGPKNHCQVAATSSACIAHPMRDPNYCANALHISSVKQLIYWHWKNRHPMCAWLHLHNWKGSPSKKSHQIMPKPKTNLAQVWFHKKRKIKKCSCCWPCTIMFIKMWKHDLAFMLDSTDCRLYQVNSLKKGLDLWGS